MPAEFDFAVIGRGMMGSACARHLAEGGARVVLVGPDEPADRARHTGPFGSHHDEARITRRLATDPDWSRLCTRSIARYPALEQASGQAMFTRSGGMMAGPADGPGSAFTQGFRAVARDAAIVHEAHDGATLPVRFPFFRFAPDTLAAWEPGGGHINPRVMRDAQTLLAERAGATVIREPVTGFAGTTLTLASGATIGAAHVVAATGGYAFTDGLLPARPAMRVYARTIAFAEVDETEAARLAGMPCLVYIPEGLSYDLYLLPPIRYPDGRLYIKIGGQDDSPLLTNDAEMTEWFRSGGDTAAGEVLLDHLRHLMPGLAIRGTHTDACAVSFTATTYPYIARLSDDLTLLTGGNGSGAKCSDELGRLGALMARGAGLDGEGYGTDFHAVLA